MAQKKKKKKIFFKQKTAYEMLLGDWSSDVCSSDLALCMPVISRHSLGFCPSPVSVQDDGNMLRYVHCISSFLQVFPSRRWKREASSHLPLLLFRNIGLSHRLYPKLSVLLWILLPPLYRLLQCICLSVSEVNLPSL